ncbi:DUF443 family protein [Lentibacillus sp. L22]|uniref:DUF443 family protein n=1 Tax=Lentibacillus sp. L22 TaxID=3163028 RepID=UPI0034663919
MKDRKNEKTGGSYLVFATGVSYTGGMFLAPLMDYFNVPMSPLINIALLVLAIVLVGLLSFSISRNRKKKMYDVLKFETLPRGKLWIRPGSVRHFLNVLLSYLVILGLSVFFFLGYVESRNFMVLIVASGVLFGIFLLNHKTFKEGNITVKLKDRRI